MRKTIDILLSVGVLLLTVANAGCNVRMPFNPSDRAASQPAAAASETEAARQGIATFQKFVNATNFRKLGFSAEADVKRAKTAEPLPMQRIELNAIKNYHPGQDAAALLVDAKRSLYPVVVDEQVVSSIAVTHSSDGWRATDFGNATLARVVAQYRRDPQDFLVQVPALKLYFIGRRSDGSLQLTAVANNERHGFKAGEVLASDKLFASLQREVSEYNGLPQ